MAAVQNSDIFLFPFHAKIKAQPNLRTVPLGDVNARWTSWRRSDYFYPEMIPEPDYSESEEGESSDEPESSEEEGSGASGERLRDVEEENENEEDTRRRSVHRPSKLEITSDTSLPKLKSETVPRLKKSQSLEEGLIIPKKPSNPYLESTERKKLHKELKFKQKYGKNVMNERSELQRALEKYTERTVKRDIAASRRTSLEKILEQQARKIELQEREGIVDETPAWIERIQRQHLPRPSDPKTDEFYRVHARVVSNLMSSFSAMDEGSQSSADSSSRVHDFPAYSESDG